jgi:CHAT domain-containing protein/Tfp pilus assembly protein PilF
LQTPAQIFDLPDSISRLKTMSLLKKFIRSILVALPIKELNIILLTIQGTRLWNRGRLTEARSNLEKAYAIGNELHDSTFQGFTLVQLGTACLYFKQPQKALTCFEKVLGDENVSQKLGRLAAEAHWGIGMAQLQYGRYQDALQHLLESVSIAGKTKDMAVEAKGLKGLAEVYGELGRFDEAITCLQSSLKPLGILSKQAEIGGIFNILGTIYWQQGKQDAALSAFQRALRLIGKNNPHAVTVLHNIGTLYASTGRIPEASIYLNQALNIKGQIGERSQTASTLNSLGTALVETGSYAEAMTLFRQALAIHQKAGDRPGEAIVRQNMATALLLTGEDFAAEVEAKGVVDLAETVRPELISDELRTGYFIKVQEAYKLYIHLLMSRSYKLKERSAVIQAFDLNERRRSRALLDLVTGKLIVRLHNNMPELPQGVRELYSKIMQVQQHLLLEANNSSELWQAWHKSSLLAERNRLETEYRLHYDTILSRQPLPGSFNQAGPITHEEVLSQLMDSDTALLEYVLMDPNSYLWVLTQQTQAVYRLSARNTIEPMIRTLIQSLNSRDAIQLPHAYDLYQMLIQAAEPIIRGKRLVIVADDILSYLPFGILLTEPPTQDTIIPPAPGRHRDMPFLIRHYPISYIPSAGVLRALRQMRSSVPTAWNQDLLAIADPLLPGANKTTAASGQIPESTLLDARYSLPGTRREVQAIAGLFEESRCRLLMGAQATKSAILPEVAGSRYIHFATHAFISDDKPELSGLLLSPGMDGDCFLTPFDIMDLNLNADMVVLSACNTGRGKIVSGEGLLGLSRAFLAAGARTVIVSLWRVNDESTARLMQFFYEALKKAHGSQNDKANALQQAQIKLMSESPWDHPHFWAPFVVIGDWQ